MKILFFAQTREVTRLPTTEWVVETPQSADALWTWLKKLHPDLASFQGSTRLARNGEYLGAGELLNPGDEVALIPPVSGG